VSVDLSPQFCAQLREAFERAGYHADGVLGLLGESAHQALGRGEPEPARRASRDNGPLGTLVRLFLIGDELAEKEVRAVLPWPESVAAGVVRTDGDRVRAALDVRPYGDDEGSWWVFADLDSDQLGKQVPTDHVLGVGHASLSLARATVRRPVGTMLDLGTGCGVQALHGSRHARRITATDVSPRALALANATFGINNIDVETRQGSWFGPVQGRRFDQVVCNPPFVVGPSRVDYVYRDSGLAGDDASALVIGALPEYLNDGGVGQLLASWLHLPGQDWAERVMSWLPGGVDAWFVQRDVAEPELYVGTWLRDAGIDPRSPEGSARASAWLDWFAENKVAGVGFGYVTIRRTSGEPRIVCEDLRHAFDDPLGHETAGWLDRVDWLRAHSSPDALLSARLKVPDSVVLEEVLSPGPDGWAAVVRRLHRTDGPGWQREIDEVVRALLAGCQGALPLGDLLDLLAAAHDVPSDALIIAALPLVDELVRHGMLEEAP
jgi:methylase of polypeptide subunit release factors